MLETTKTTNRLLAALPEKEFQNLLPKLERIDLVYAENIYQPDDVIRDVYFPESGIVSLLSAVEDDATLEVGVVGNEGMVGLPVFLGVKTSNNRAVVQGVGAALKMSAANFLAESKTGALPFVLRRFTNSLITQISQSAACNRFHAIDSRLARWLLLTHDRMQTDEFQLTQEFLSNMLGVRREGVNKAATSFQQQKVISYNRGYITILNRKMLETAACRCYFIIKKEYDNFPD